MKSILVLSFFPAFVPPSSGGEARLFNIYRELSRHCRVVLISSGHMDVPVENIEHNANFREVRVPKSAEFAAAWAELSQGAGQGDLSAPSLALSSRRFNALHEAYLKEYQGADFIVHESPFLIDYDLFLGWDTKPRIYNSYNVEYDLYSAMHHGGSGRVSEVTRACEEKTLRSIRNVFVCSEEDRSRFRQLYPFDNEFTLVPNGISAFRMDGEEVGSRQGMVFLGSGHLPNMDAAQTIVTRIAPLFPDQHFDIIGDCLAPGRYGDNVVAHGRLSDAGLTMMLRHAAYAVIPITMGGGSSLKVADFASRGVPIISTAIGVRGFDFVAGEHYLPLDLGDVATSVGIAISDGVRALEVGERARQHIRESFTWDQIAARMADLIAKILAEVSDGPNYLILNDYDPYESVGGGCTRLREFGRALTETAHVLIMCFTNGECIKHERVGKVLLLGIPKMQSHKDYEARISAQFHISVADIVASEEAEHNPALIATYAAAASVADIVICEHPYMVALPRMNGDRFVYSSQNFELGLKRQMLQWHPSRDSLIASLARTEGFAVACSALVVAVSDEDATAIGATYPASAPIVTIPNGASEPAPFDADDHADVINGIGPRSVLFLGSSHIPNIEAMQFILETLVPQLPDVQFHIVGSVCNPFEHLRLPNLKLWGIVNDDRKSAICENCTLAINPMVSGSGSNVKMADYLKNGLHVVSTEFGARSYGSQGEIDVTLCDTASFADKVRALLDDKRSSLQARQKRRERLANQLSMFANGRVYAGLLRDLLKKRRSALYVTYRYNYPRRGGGEVYVNRLIEGLAESGYDVDVIAPAVIDIRDHLRFGSFYTAEGGLGGIPVGQARVRTARFPLDDTYPDRDAIAAIWKSQGQYQRELALALPLTPSVPALGWGWDSPENGGRWTYRSFGFFLPEAATVTFSAHAINSQTLCISSSKDGVLVDREVRGNFSFSFSASAGWVEGGVYHCALSTIDDVRPLGLFTSSLRVGEKELIGGKPLDAFLRLAEPDALFRAQHHAYRRSRHLDRLSLTDVRGPHSAAMTDYIEDNIREYDLLITHNVVFKTATDSINIAKNSGVPSLLIPHTHLEDDYYHFDDIYRAYEQADTVLVSPRSAVEFMKELGISGVRYHAPGIDTAERFTDADVAAFRKVYRDSAPFFLVLGRKSGAKGYCDVIEACGHLPEQWGAKVVMIGPDDDQLAVDSAFATYLGLQDRAVVRGALMSCTALVSMSESESFGIVLLEAGMAGVPVLANRHCPAFADLVEDGENGYLTIPEELTSFMMKILEQPQLRQDLGARGHERALKHAWSKVIDDFVDQCDALVSRSMMAEK